MSSWFGGAEGRGRGGPIGNQPKERVGTDAPVCADGGGVTSSSSLIPQGLSTTGDSAFMPEKEGHPVPMAATLLLSVMRLLADHQHHMPEVCVQIGLPL